MPRGTNESERQVEFGAAADLELPDLREVVGGTERLPEQQLTETYFDTGDLRLWQRGITLRHRVEEDASGAGQAGIWLLGLPVDAPAAPGANPAALRWVGNRAQIPTDATTALRGVVRRATLDVVAELVTVRRRLLLRNRGGEIWAEVDDDLVTVRSGPQDGLSFRKLRVDLVGTAEGQLDPVLAELRHAGARREDQERLGKILGPGPFAASHPASDAERGSVGALVAATIATDLGRLLDQDVALRLDPRHPPAGAVHQARVATRRLRSDLKTLAALLDPVWARHIRAELKTVGEALGGVRDADVLAQRLEVTRHAGAADEAMFTLSKRLTDERDQAASALAELIGGEQYLNVLDRLHAASVRPPLLAGTPGRTNGSGEPAAQVLPPLVREQWRTLRRRVRKAGKDPSDDRLHRIRIAAKQLRYASELSEPAIGRPARRTAAAAEALQDLLGDHHDAVSAEAWLRNTGRTLHSDPAAAFAAGLLAADAQRRAQELRGRWRATWEQVKKKKARRWMA